VEWWGGGGQVLPAPILEAQLSTSRQRIVNQEKYKIEIEFSGRLKKKFIFIVIGLCSQ
jgi:hypothetical protein